MISLKTPLHALTLAISTTLLSACAAPPPPVAPGLDHAVANPFEVDTREYQRLFDAALVVMDNNSYQIDRNNYRFGVITTKPQASPTILEPWYADVNATWRQVDSSTLDQIQRIVTIRIAPGRVIKHDYLADQKLYTVAEPDTFIPETAAQGYDLTIPDQIETTLEESPSAPRSQAAEDAFLKAHNIPLPDADENIPTSVPADQAPSALEPLPAEPGISPQAFGKLPPELEKLNDNEYYLFVNVEMQRLVHALRYLNGRAGNDVFASLKAVPIEWRRRGIPPVYWETIGRDPYAEQKFLAEIVRESFNQ